MWLRTSFRDLSPRGAKVLDRTREFQYCKRPLTLDVSFLAVCFTHGQVTLPLQLKMNVSWPSEVERDRHAQGRI